MFEQITIIGMGLIGSSLARAVKKHKLAEKMIAADISQDVCRRVEALGLADAVSNDIGAAVEGSDFVFLAVPVGAFENVGAAIRDHLRPGCILNDAGSVKQAVIRALDLHLPDTVNFVPGHPIAGTEFSGPEAGFAELFEGRWCILTPLAEVSVQAVEKVTNLWEACGSKIEIMDASHHDLVLGITSHLPHLIAYTIVETACELEGDTQSEVIKFSASGFRDFTRIASSDPIMWRDVFLNNKEAVLEILQRFTEDLTAMQKAIRRGDGEHLYRIFSETREMRRRIIEVGQADYAVPGGALTEGTPPSTLPQKIRNS